MNSYRIYNIEQDDYTCIQAPFPSFAVMTAAANADGVCIREDIISGYESRVDYDGPIISIYPWFYVNYEGI